MRQSGVWVLLVYVVLVVVAMCGAIGIMFGLDKIAPAHAGWVFIAAMGAALIGPWPLALWLTDKPA